MKTVLLGAAAGLVTVGAAHAADLPMMKAEPVEYVKVCSEFGQGFWYIPGSDTCIKLGGLVRLDARYNSPVSRNDNAFRFNVRGQLSVETNTNSEIGPIHTFTALNGDVNTNDFGSGGSNAVTVDHAYLQFAGVTAGYNDTFFRFLDKYGYNDINTIVSYKSAGALDQLAYTATFGGAFSATVAAESGVARRNGIGDAIGDVHDGYAGQTVPDIVALINYDQAKNGFGAAQLSGALHQVRSIDDRVGTDYGYAVGGGVSVNLPLAAGAKVGVEANYADGATSYLGGPGRIATRDETAGFSSGSSVPDAFVNAADDDLAKTSGYSIAGDFGVFLTPTLFAGVYGSYTHLDLPDAALAGNLRGYQIATDVRYQLVKNLFINGEVGYANEKFSGGDDNDTVYGTVRVERDF